VSAFGLSTRLICDLTYPRIKPLDVITIVDADVTTEMIVSNAMVQYNEFGPYYQELQCSSSDEPEIPAT
jgi:hypothetical protein